MDVSNARIRNLKLKLHKISTYKGYDILDETYSEEEIRTNLFFKKSDIKNYINTFFDENGNGYIIKQLIKEDIKEFSNKSEEYKENKEEIEAELEKKYQQMNDCLYKFKYGELAELVEETKSTAMKLHWIYLPIYPEDVMLNRDIIPEENCEEYYNHFHTIEDLYRMIFEKKEIKWDSIEGDINLNIEMKLTIYSTRWGHEDEYIVKRILDGWHFKHLSYDCICSKNGTINGKVKSGFFEILSHDSIQSPSEGVRYALEILWENADSTSMSKNELEFKLQEIGNWISAVEKTTKDLQPGWLGYY